MHAWPVRVTSERVVSVDHDTIRALSRESGEVQWHRVFDDSLESWHLVGDVGILSTRDGRTHALSIDDGAELWSVEGGRHLAAHRAGPDAVHLLTDVAGGPPVLAAHAPQNGSVQWEYELPERDDDIGFQPQIAQAGPLTLLTLDAPRNLDLLALDREDGTERWRRRDSRPFHASDGVVVVVEIERIVDEEGGSLSISESLTALVGVDATDGTERWRQELHEEAPHPMELVDDILVMADDGEMTAFDLATGEERWHVRGHENEHPVSTAPWWWGEESRVTDVLLGVVPQESLVVARDAGTGELRWRTQLDRPIGDVTMVDGVVTVRTTQDSYVQLNAASGAMMGTVTVDGSELPMFVAGDVLVDQRSGWLVAIDLPPQ